MSFKNHSLTSYQNIYSNISFPKAVKKTCPCGVTIFTSHHKVITSSRSLQTRLLHQGVTRLLRHDDVDQSQTVSKSADFRCEKMHFCSSESRKSRIFGISALKTIVLRNKTKLFSTCNWSRPLVVAIATDQNTNPGYMSRKIRKFRTDKFDT